MTMSFEQELQRRTKGERQQLLRNVIREEKEDLERYNGGKVLEQLTDGTVDVGDEVEYITALGEKRQGYVSHFFEYHGRNAGRALAQCASDTLALIEGRPALEDARSIVAIIIPKNGKGYATHHGPNPLRKIE